MNLAEICKREYPKTPRIILWLVYIDCYNNVFFFNLWKLTLLMYFFELIIYSFYILMYNVLRFIFLIRVLILVVLNV